MAKRADYQLIIILLGHEPGLTSQQIAQRIGSTTRSVAAVLGRDDPYGGVPSNLRREYEAGSRLVHWHLTPAGQAIAKRSRLLPGDIHG